MRPHADHFIRLCFPQSAFFPNTGDEHWTLLTRSKIQNNSALAPSRFMVGCGRCDDWFHGDCVGLDLAKVREMEEEDQMYVCLKCCEEESRKVEAEAAKPQAPPTTEAQESRQPPKPRPGPSQAPPLGGGKPAKKVSNHGNKLFNQPLISVFFPHLHPQLLPPY